MNDLLTAISTAGQMLIDRELASPAEIADAYDDYAQYFFELLHEPDLPPPTSLKPSLDRLLLTLWDVIVDREEKKLDASLIAPEGFFPTYDHLYGAVFEQLLSKADKVTYDIDDMVAELLRISTDIGVPIYEHTERDELPAAARKKIEKIAEYEPGPQLIRALDRLSKEYPRHLAVQSIVVQGMLSPEAVARHAADWGSPIDIHRVGEIGERGISLREYTFFERACLTVYAARLDPNSLLRSLDRLITLGQVSPSEEVPLTYFLGQHAQAEIQANRLMPISWHPPIQDPTLPFASSYLLEMWETMVEDSREEFDAMLAESNLQRSDLNVPQGRYQLKVTLSGIRPPIWRRLIVPAGIELKRLHLVIQSAMGWYNGHLHQFISPLSSYGPTDVIDDGLYESYEGLTLNILVQEPGHKIHYEYDFGDGWEHELLLEKVLAKGSGTQVQCIKGKRACPPEDCGGIGGYYALLEATAHPEREESADYLEWYGGPFAAEAFSLEEVNERLAGI